MSGRVRRLTRLERIRRMQADAEMNELQRLHGDVSALERIVASQRESAMQRSKICSDGDLSDSHWHLLAAENTLACHYLERTLVVMEEANIQFSRQRLRVEESSRAYRQIERLVASAMKLEVQKAGRAEQRVMDDLFSARSATQPIHL